MRKPGSGKSVLSENGILKSMYRVMAPEVTCSVTLNLDYSRKFVQLISSPQGKQR
jgi:hypothetical protein